jgi:hypothetical protein
MSHRKYHTRYTQWLPRELTHMLIAFVDPIVLLEIKYISELVAAYDRRMHVTNYTRDDLHVAATKYAIVTNLLDDAKKIYRHLSSADKRDIARYVLFNNTSVTIVRIHHIRHYAVETEYSIPERQEDKWRDVLISKSDSVMELISKHVIDNDTHKRYMLCFCRSLLSGVAAQPLYIGVFHRDTPRIICNKCWLYCVYSAEDTYYEFLSLNHPHYQTYIVSHKDLNPAIVSTLQNYDKLQNKI